MLIYIRMYFMNVLWLYMNMYVCTYLMIIQVTYAALQFSEEACGNGKNDILCKEELGISGYPKVEHASVRALLYLVSVSVSVSHALSHM